MRRIHDNLLGQQETALGLAALDFENLALQTRNVRIRILRILQQHIGLVFRVFRMAAMVVDLRQLLFDPRIVPVHSSLLESPRHKLGLTFRVKLAATEIQRQLLT